MGFSQALREARKAHGLSQTDLATKVGTSQTAVSDWENGTYQPKLALLPKLAEALGFDLAVLVKIAAGDSLESTESAEPLEASA